MANDPNIKIKLAATGGDQAAKEVAKVETAVSDLATETKKLPAELVPAWDQTTKAVEETAVAEKAVSDASKDVDAAFEGVRGRAAALRAKIEEMRGSINATAGTGAGGGGGIKGLGASLLSFAGGPVGIAITALTALVGWMASLKARIDAVKESQDDFAKSARETSDRIADIRTPADEAATALENYQTAMAQIVDNTEGVITQIDARTAATKRQRDAAAALRDAVLALQVAEGKKTPEQAAKEKGANTVSDLRAEAEAELAAAQAKNAQVEAAIQQSIREITAAQEALRRARGDKGFLTTAEQAAAANTAAARAAANVQAIEANGPDLALAGKRGGIIGLAGGIVDYALQMREQAVALEAAQAEQEKLKAAAAGLTDLSIEEKEAYESRVAEQQKLVDAAKRSLEQLRAQQAAVAAELVAADQNARLVENYAVPTTQTETATQLATMEAKRAEEKRREEERIAKEREREAARQRAESQDLAAVSLAQNIRDQVAAAPNPGADTSGVLPLLTQIAQALSNGTNAVEQANISAQLSSAIAALSAEQTQTRALLQTVQSQLQNLRR